MPYMILLFVSRKPGMSPEAFKAHYETTHIPLLQSIAGDHSPTTHTRRYVQRSRDQQASSTPGDDGSDYPATVLVGTQADFDYDAIAELVFDDEAASQALMGAVGRPEAAELIAQDEEKFLDRAKTKVVVVDDRRVTSGSR